MYLVRSRAIHRTLPSTMNYTIRFCLIASLAPAGVFANQHGMRVWHSVGCFFNMFIETPYVPRYKPQRGEMCIIKIEI